MLVHLFLTAKPFISPIPLALLIKELSPLAQIRKMYDDNESPCLSPFECVNWVPSFLFTSTEYYTVETHDIINLIHFSFRPKALIAYCK